MTAAVLWLALGLMLEIETQPAQPQIWKPFTAPDGRYSVCFPGIPVEKRATVKTSMGPLEGVERTVRLDGNREFLVSQTPMPQILVQRFDARIAAVAFDSARRGFLRRLQGELTGERELVLMGYPGREWRCVVPASGTHEETEIITRVYLVGIDYTTLAYSAPHSKFSAADGTRFLDSFRVSQPSETPRQDYDWQVFESAEGGYRVRFPGPPVVSRLISESTVGPVPIVYQSVVREPDLTWTVCSNEMPGGGPTDDEAAFSAARDRAVCQIQGRVLGERPVIVQGVRGREIEIEVPDRLLSGGGTRWLRYFIWQGRFYQLSFQAPHDNPFLEGRDALFDSFQLTARR